MPPTRICACRISSTAWRCMAESWRGWVSTGVARSLRQCPDANYQLSDRLLEHSAIELLERFDAQDRGKRGCHVHDADKPRVFPRCHTVAVEQHGDVGIVVVRGSVRGLHAGTPVAVWCEG